MKDQPGFMATRSIAKLSDKNGVPVLIVDKTKDKLEAETMDLSNDSHVPGQHGDI